MKKILFPNLLAGIAICVVACQSQLPMDLSQIASLKVSDEEKIALVLQEVQRGMESRRIYQVLAHVSRNYRDREGRDYSALSRDLNTLIQNYRDIRIRRAAPNIQVQGDRARVIDTFGASAEAVDPLQNPPINVQGQVSILLERVGNSWQILEWGPIN